MTERRMYFKYYYAGKWVPWRGRGITAFAIRIGDRLYGYNFARHHAVRCLIPSYLQKTPKAVR